MTKKEVKAVFDQMRLGGMTDEDILGSLYLLYQDGKVTTDELRHLIGVLGYEFDERFAAMSEEDKHVKGLARREDKKE